LIVCFDTGLFCSKYEKFRVKLTVPYETIVPVWLKRCGIETRLIVKNGKPAPAHQSSVDAIRGALARALAWNKALVSRTASSMTELARGEKVTQRYIAHLIKLTYLAPDIMQSIARGDIPPALSLDRLKMGFPLDWNEQQKTLGFKP
jgi:hypothetical protein